jgi:hypothetical protein
MLAANNVLEAIYDGPIDSTGFSYQPVILEKLPSWQMAMPPSSL